MSDHSELKIAANGALGHANTSFALPALLAFERFATPSAVLALIAEIEQLRNTTGAAMFLMLTEELAALRKKLTTVHFVCDRLPDQDGCRFIELENPQGESLGSDAGEWEIRPDGLVQLVVEIASPDVKRMAALLECAQGDLKQAMQSIEKNSKDAERYRFLRIDVTRGGDTDFCIVKKFWKAPSLERIISLDDADQEIDAAMSEEG